MLAAAARERSVGVPRAHEQLPCPCPAPSAGLLLIPSGLPSSGVPLIPLERRLETRHFSSLPLVAFLNDHLTRRRPVLIQGYLEHCAWSALETWGDLARWKARHGHRTVPVELWAPSSTSCTATATTTLANMTLSRFVDEFLVPSNGSQGAAEGEHSFIPIPRAAVPQGKEQLPWPQQHEEQQQQQQEQRRDHENEEDPMQEKLLQHEHESELKQQRSLKHRELEEEKEEGMEVGLPRRLIYRPSANLLFLVAPFAASEALTAPVLLMLSRLVGGRSICKPGSSRNDSFSSTDRLHLSARPLPPAPRDTG